MPQERMVVADAVGHLEVIGRIERNALVTARQRDRTNDFQEALRRTERITEGTFADHIAAARTFGFLKEVEWLRQNGLALGGSLENAIVIGDTGVLNALRFEDEFVRHKILDVVGDLALVGYPIVGHVVAHRAGHALHTALASEILADQDAWCLVETPAAVPDSAFEPVGATGAARAH